MVRLPLLLHLVSAGPRWHRRVPGAGSHKLLRPAAANGRQKKCHLLSMMARASRGLFRRRFPRLRRRPGRLSGHCHNHCARRLLAALRAQLFRRRVHFCKPRPSAALLMLQPGRRCVRRRMIVVADYRNGTAVVAVLACERLRELIWRILAIWRICCLGGRPGLDAAAAMDGAAFELLPFALVQAPHDRRHGCSLALEGLGGLSEAAFWLACCRAGPKVPERASGGGRAFAGQRK